MTEETIADTISRALAGLGFAAYAGAALEGHDDVRARLFALVDEVLAGAGEERLRAWRAELRTHLDRPWTRERFYDGVSRAREDRNRHWEEQLAEIRARSSHVGAVQLELGAWSAFPAERQRHLADKDGLAEFIRLDFDPSFDVDVVADARRLPFADNSIDRISADSVLEHIPHPHEVLRECFRVLRPGGALRVATPFVFNLHGYPDDYLRFTPSWYELACREAGFESVVTDSDAARGLYYTLHNSAKAAVVLDDEPDALRVLHLLVIELLGTLAPLDNAFHNGARQWFHSVRCLALKAGPLELSHRERRWDLPFAERCLDLLACPQSRAPLTLSDGGLVSEAAGLVYPVREGRPVFTESERLPARRGRLARLVRRGSAP